MKDFSQLIVVAILVEAIWENIKMIYQNKKFSISMIGSLCISILICILANMNIFEMVDIEMKVPIICNIFTGIICSRGANLVSDLFTKIKKGDK